MTFKILCLVLFKFGAFFVIISSLNYYLYFMVGASGCAEEPDIRDELRFFWTVSAWESEFVVGDSYCSSLASFVSNSFILLSFSARTFSCSFL